MLIGLITILTGTNITSWVLNNSKSNQMDARRPFDFKEIVEALPTTEEVDSTYKAFEVDEAESSETNQDLADAEIYRLLMNKLEEQDDEIFSVCRDDNYEKKLTAEIEKMYDEKKFYVKGEEVVLKNKAGEYANSIVKDKFIKILDGINNGTLKGEADEFIKDQ